MDRCSVKPYEGHESFIFISYCHKDSGMVFPVIEQLAADGYRVWYDEGIDPGSEWPEIIADHLNKSTVCIAFISPNSVNSHNCKREINFALLKKKPFISIVLMETELSLGMEMQLSATQAIFKYKLHNDGEFFRKLYEAKFLSECFGRPSVSLKKESVLMHKFFIVRNRTSEKIPIGGDGLKIGRSETKTDYRIADNSTIGRLHATISIKNGRCFITDNNSCNGTFLNDKQLMPDRPYELHVNDIIRLSNEEFTFCPIEEQK